MTQTSAPQVECDQLSPTTYRLAVSVPVITFRQKLDSAYTEIAKTAQIPGFRPGKAPRNILERHFDKDMIIQQTIEDVIEATLLPILKEKEFTPVGRPRIDHESWVEGEEFRYTAILEILPPIPEIDYGLLKAVLPEREVTDEMVQEELRRLSIRMGEAKAIEDRVVQNGDFLLIRFEGEVADVKVDSIDGERAWKVVEEYMEVEVGGGRSIDGLEEQLVGMELEEIKEFELALTDKFPDKRVRGKVMKATARVLSVREVSPAELTDEFVKEKFSEQEIETLAGLMERISEEIQRSFIHMDEHATMDQLEAYLSRAFDFPLPEGLVRSKYAQLLDRTLASFKQDGVDIEELMEEGSRKGEIIRKRTWYQAHRIVRIDLIIMEIARKESIRVSNEEVANYLMMLAMQQGISEKDLRTLMQDPQFIGSTKDELLNKKVMHFLFSKVETDRVSAEEFVSMMESAREEGEAHQEEFLETVEDPDVIMERDYLAADREEEEAGGASESDEVEAESVGTGE